MPTTAINLKSIQYKPCFDISANTKKIAVIPVGDYYYYYLLLVIIKENAS